MNEETSKLMYSCDTHEWYTPMNLYRKLDEEFHFDIDPCTEPSNRLGCKIFFTEKDDGLSKDWPTGNIFCNPPYGRRGKGHEWVKKCAEHALQGKGIAVLLIAARTDTKWFHDYIWKKPNVTLEFLKGRLKFDNSGYKKNSAPFPSLIAVFWPPQNNNVKSNVII